MKWGAPSDCPWVLLARGYLILYRPTTRCVVLPAFGHPVEGPWRKCSGAFAHPRFFMKVLHFHNESLPPTEAQPFRRAWLVCSQSAYQFDGGTEPGAVAVLERIVSGRPGRGCRL